MLSVEVEKFYPLTDICPENYFPVWHLLWIDFLQAVESHGLRKNHFERIKLSAQWDKNSYWIFSTGVDWVHESSKFLIPIFDALGRI